jgi:hypothetical protein
LFSLFSSRLEYFSPIKQPVYPVEKSSNREERTPFAVVL